MGAPRARSAEAPDRRAEQLACPLGACDGSGWILGPEDTARPCECRERRIARARSRGVDSVIPRRFRGVGLDRPPISDMARSPGADAAVDAVRAFIEDLDAKLDRGRGLWFMGDVGTGKTTLAMLVSKAALESGRSVAIYSTPRLLARIRRTYEADAGEQSYLEFFERLTSVDLLHLDDLGAEKRSDWVLEQLYAIVNERYEAERSIVVTMNSEGTSDPNEAIDALREGVGDRTVSRLVESCELVTLFGEDRRSAPW